MCRPCTVIVALGLALCSSSTSHARRYMCDFGPRATIGVALCKDAKTGFPRVVTPYRHGTAFKHGIQAGDLITMVRLNPDSGENPVDPRNLIATQDLPLDQLWRKMRGEVGSPITLFIRREGRELPFAVTLPRSGVKPEYVVGSHRNPNASWEHWLDRSERIGYIRLMAFGNDTAREVEAVVRGLECDDLKGLVLDLRFNPGGLISSSREVADLFVEDGVIVTIEVPRKDLREVLRGTREKSHTGFPVVVLLNGETASSAEIVAACLQDHKRATVIGERSRGKGSVQNIISFSGGELKLTTAVFKRPSGKSLERFYLGDDDQWGVRPDAGCDIPLSLRERDDLLEHLWSHEIILPPGRKRPATTFRDVQLEKALQVLRDRSTKTAPGDAPARPSGK